jgi:radical SAM-linked protein
MSGVGRWRLRLSYAKTGRPRFVSHLDLIRLFERAARRIGLPLSMSEGYSPAPRIAYGWPLPVGTSGLCEYVDVELAARVAPEAVVNALNQVLPEGLEIREGRYLSPQGPSAMAEFNVASYLVQLPAGGREVGEWRAAVEALLSRPKLDVTRDRGASPGRGQPRKSKVVDVRPLLRRVQVREIVAGDRVTLFMELALSDRGAGRPDEVAGLVLGELAGREAEGARRAETGEPLRPRGMTAVRLGFRQEG